jgi:hypothetical protein
MSSQISLTALLGLFALSTAQIGLAGLITISVDDGTSVGFAVVYSDGSTYSVGGTDGSDERRPEENGVITLPKEGEIPNQDKVVAAAVTKVRFGKKITLDVDMTPPTTLASLEPFGVPTFVAAVTDTPLLTIIDLTAFLSEGNPFTAGQTVAVSNGSIAETSTIVFRDASSLPSDPVAASLASLDPAVRASLPDFTGTVIVAEADQFAAVPETSIADMVGLALLCFMWYGRHPHRQHTSSRRV